MANKKDNKSKYEDLLIEAYNNAGEKSGNSLSQNEIEELLTNLIDNVDPEKVPQFLANNKDKLSRIPEIASLVEFNDIVENPKVIEKDYGFTEGEDFYKLEGDKSWMNKTPVQLEANAKRYGMELGEYLNLVAKLSTEKEKERQWKDNATAHTFKDVPYIGDVNVPGLTSIMLPTSFNKASLGKDVTKGDIAYDIGTDLVEGGLATAPYGGPIWAALTGNAARQGKQIYDETQDEFHPGEFIGSGAFGAFGTPYAFKYVGDVLKKVPGTQGIKQWRRITQGIEDIGEQDPNLILKNKQKELAKQTKLYRDLTANEAKKAANAQSEIAKFMNVGNVSDYVPYNPTPVETNLYGKGSKLWRNVKNGEILSDKEYQDAINFLKEANRGPDFIPGKQTLSNLYDRATKVKQMPYGDILVNAWSEPKLSQMLREGARVSGGSIGGRAGISISDNDKKEMANKIINSTEWAKYITGLPNNLTDEEIYLASMYGDK